jgi:hypothetical protein
VLVGGDGRKSAGQLRGQGRSHKPKKKAPVGAFPF